MIYFRHGRNRFTNGSNGVHRFERGNDPIGVVIHRKPLEIKGFYYCTIFFGEMRVAIEIDWSV